MLLLLLYLKTPDFILQPLVDFMENHKIYMEV